MSVLLLRLSGPMQAWGDSSRYNRRLTRHEPTKSGVVGLLASALGRSREEAIDDLASLELAVRTDQSGELLRDFQTERSLDGKKTMPLTYRYYLADARFLVALAGPDTLLEQLNSALKAPRWPLYLGRRSCPADTPILLGIHGEYNGVRQAVKQHEWLASDWYINKQKRRGVTELEVTADAHPGETYECQDDYPVTFSGQGRKYARRSVHRYRVPIPGFVENDSSKHTPATTAEHDPMFF